MIVLRILISRRRELYFSHSQGDIKCNMYGHDSDIHITLRQVTYSTYMSSIFESQWLLNFDIFRHNSPCFGYISPQLYSVVSKMWCYHEKWYKCSNSINASAGTLITFFKLNAVIYRWLDANGDFFLTKLWYSLIQSVINWAILFSENNWLYKRFTNQIIMLFNHFWWFYRILKEKTNFIVNTIKIVSTIIKVKLIGEARIIKVLLLTFTRTFPENHKNLKIAHRIK